MKTYPNQKVIERFVYAPANKENLYACINQDAMRAAMIDLKPTSFKLWCYLSKNKAGYSEALSQAACAEWGIKKTAYYDSVKELEEKGYLINESGNKYEFHQIPQYDYIPKNERNFPKTELPKNGIASSENGKDSSFSDREIIQIIQDNTLAATPRIGEAEKMEDSKGMESGTGAAIVDIYAAQPRRSAANFTATPYTVYGWEE